MAMTPLKLAEVTFAVVDLETTGFDSKGADRIIEVAVVRGKLGSKQPLDTWSSLVNPGCSIPFGATRVNHISNLMVQNQPPFAAIASELLDLLAGCVLVFHNGAFDLPFLQAELARAKADASRLSRTVADTYLLARQNYSFISNKLGDLIEQLGLGAEVKPNHRALNDTLATWRLFDWLLHDLRDEQKYPLETVPDLLRLQRRRVAPRIFTAGTAKIHTEQVVTIEESQDAQGNHWQTQVSRETDTTFEFAQLPEQADTVFTHWQGGELPLEVALATLCNHFARLDDLKKTLTEELDQLRGQISQLVQAAGGKAEVEQFGKLHLSEPQVVSSFDRKLLEGLMVQLQAEGHTALAEAIAACKSETNRAGGLRISRVSE